MQRGIDIVSEPFQGFGKIEGEGSACFQGLELVELLERAMGDGLLRRFGGVFDSQRLGYRSVLCALDFPENQLVEKAAIISMHPGVTHCYERQVMHGGGTYPALWFTLAMLQGEFEAGWETLRAELGVSESQLIQLPALKRFKIDVVFNLQSAVSDKPFLKRAVMPECVAREFNEVERALVRSLDQQMPLAKRPFSAIAEQIGQPEAWVLSKLNEWKKLGIVRRIGAILYHRQAGFKANAMCVWPVAESDIVEAGRRVANRPEVTHCYQRPPAEVFPFDLYAMIHAGSWSETDALFEEISSSCGLSGGKLFASAREFKKSSMEYFR